jgi:hypothetical protein
MSKIIVSLVLSAFFMLTITSGQAQQHANVKGNWKMSVESSVGSGSPEFDLKHVDETTLTGTYKGQLGEATVKGTIKENKIHLEFDISGNLIEYDGTVDGDNMKGSVKLGSMGEGTFTGTKKKT